MSNGQKNQIEIGTGPMRLEFIDLVCTIEKHVAVCIPFE